MNPLYIPSLEQIRVEIAVADEVAEQAVEAICEAAETGRIGDGKILVSDLGHVVRIRTREPDDAAL